MKKILPLLAFAFFVKQTKAQENLNFPKWNFGFGALTTSSIYEDFKQNDALQLNLFRVGYGLVFTTKYTINNNFNCDAVIEYSGNKLSYRSGKYNSGMSSNVSPKIHARINYLFSSTKKLKHTVGIGFINMFSSHGNSSFASFSDTIGTSVFDYTERGWYPLAQVRYGVLWQAKKQRWHQLSLYANKGFKPITAYIYINHSGAQQQGLFNFSGTYCGIEYTWFLRKNKV